MWEKAAFLSYFVTLCLAQRAAIADLRERQAGKITSSVSSATHLIPTPTTRSFPSISVDGLPTNALEALTYGVQSLDPSETTVIAVVPKQDTTPGVESLPSNVHTTVLFPEAPTTAPTGVVVPTVYTYTGTFNPSSVPSGFQTPSVAPTSLSSVPTNTRSMTSMSSMKKSFTLPKSSTQSTLKSSASSATSSKTSIASTASSTSTSQLTSSTSSSSKASSTASNPTDGAAQRPTDPPNPTHALSGRQIAGVVAGVLIGTILLAAALFILCLRKRRQTRPDSPGIYPQEAYLYDPPITPPPGVTGPEMARSGSPALSGGETAGLLGAAALGATAASSASNTPPRRPRRISLADPGPGSVPGPSRWDGYSPVDSTDITEEHRQNPFADISADEYQREIGGPRESWPLNPQADSGLGSRPGTSAAGSMWMPPSLDAGPSTPSPPPPQTGPTHIGGVGAGAGNITPLQRDVRKAWGWEQ